jgi:hypothetical protein
MQIPDFLIPKELGSFLQGIGAVLVPFIGWQALSTWQSQLRAQKQIEFLDALSDALHDLIIKLQDPIQVLSFAKIGIESYRSLPTFCVGIDHADAIQFIEAKGPEYAKRLWEMIGPAKPVVARVQTLANKGQVLGFKDYENCFSACTMLVWSYNQLDSFAALIADKSLNWAHPEVQKMLGNLEKIDVETIQKNLSEQNIALIEFCKTAYEKALS